MKLAVVLSVQPARFEAATFKGHLGADLGRIAGLGYDGVELAIRDPARVDSEEILDQLGPYGLDVPAIGTGQAWSEEGLSMIDPSPDTRRTTVERVMAHIPFASRVGAQIVIGLVRGVSRQGQTREEAMRYLIEGLGECAQVAAVHSVRLALEPINRYETTLINTVEQGLELLDLVGAQNVGLLLDTFHMNIEEPSITESIRRASGRIFHVHIADSNRYPPGAGHLDFPQILDALDREGYKGYLSGEFLPRPDPESAAACSISFMRTLERNRGTGDTPLHTL